MQLGTIVIFQNYKGTIDNFPIKNKWRYNEKGYEPPCEYGSLTNDVFKMDQK